MDIETIRSICNGLRGVTEDIKWGNDLCFLIGGKMFCVCALEGPLNVSFKVKDDEFEELSCRPGIIPAPYLARYKWVRVEDPSVLINTDWRYYIEQSYQLILDKLPKKLRDSVVG